MRHWRSRDISAQALETAAIAGGDGDVAVQGEARVDVSTVVIDSNVRLPE